MFLLFDYNLESLLQFILNAIYLRRFNLVNRIFLPITMANNCDREFWEEFFNLYRLHPCLWDSKSSDYLNRHKRNDAYNELVLKSKEKFTEANKDFATKKIHGFRCCFRRELKKVRGNKSGDGADDVYVPNLWYYDILSFIADSETPRIGKTNIQNIDNDLDEELDEHTEYSFKVSS